ncbi:MAG TPA: hypothetical protein VFY29_21010 [Terriglobia bacterium]|nr:hypothetical protein [Terriglobia bacterium]
MKNRLLAAAVIIGGVLSTVYAADIDFSGKWSTNPQRRSESSGTIGKIFKGLLGSQVTVGSLGPDRSGPLGQPPRGRGDWGVGPRGPIDANPRGFGGWPRQPIGGNDVFTPGGSGAFFNGTTLTANLKVDRRKNTVQGSIKFTQPDSYSVLKTPVSADICKGFDIEDGVLLDDGGFMFNTRFSFRGVSIPTRWSGRIFSDDSMRLEPLGALPCSEGPWGAPALGSTIDTLLFHHAEQNEPGLAGKWWTRDPGAIGVLELKVDTIRKTVTGVFENVCHESRKLAGTFTGDILTLTTPDSVRGYGETRWEGRVADNNLLLTAEPPPQCVIERPQPYTLFQTN